MVERGSGVAVWRQIGESLAKDIRDKLYAPGERLPTEPELAAKFAVNRHTIRRAMSALEQEGLVRIEQGRGTFVQENAIDYAIGKRTRFSENLRSQGMSGHVEVMGSQLLRSAEIARHLSLPQTTQLLRIQLLGRAEDRTIDIADHYFEAERFAGMAEKLGVTNSISKAYLEYGIVDYTRKWTRITATLPSADVARMLNQPKTRPILQVEALNVDQAQVPLQYSLARFVGDWVQLVVTDEG